MIEAECPNCGSQGPHPVLQDTGLRVQASCPDCFHGFAVSLVPQDADPRAVLPGYYFQERF